MFFYIIIFFICYLICAINPAIEICRRKTGQDIRDLGSGNAGTTNSVRVMGKGFGLLVFALDAIKALVSFWVVMLLCKIFSREFAISIKSVYMVACLMGHCFPVYYGFKGGKGIVVLLVAALCINKQIAIVCIIVAFIIILVTRTVSKGTLSGVLLYIIMTFVMMPEYIIAVIMVSSIVFFRHKENIVRIMNKEEQKLF